MDKEIAKLRIMFGFFMVILGCVLFYGMYNSHYIKSNSGGAEYIVPCFLIIGGVFIILHNIRNKDKSRKKLINKINNSK